MPLQKQTASINFGQGLDTKTDPKQVVPGKFLTLENAVWKKLGQLSMRNGFTSLSASVSKDPSITYSFSNLTTSISAGRFIAGLNDEQVLGDGFNLYSYSPSVAAWVYKGRATSVSLTSAPVVRNINSQSQADSAISSTGARLFAWEDSTGGVRLSVTDASTGQVFVSNLLLSATASRPRCVAVGAQLVCFYWDTSNSSINYVTVNNGTVSASVQAVSDANATKINFDAVPVGSNLVLAYNCSANTNNSIKVALFTGAMVAGQSLLLTGQKADNCISVFSTQDGYISIAWGDGTTTTRSTTAYPDLSAWYQSVPSTFGTVTATEITGSYDSTGTATVFVGAKGTAVNGYFSNGVVYQQRIQKGGTAGGFAEFARGVCLQSKAFQVSNIPHVMVVRDCALQPTYYLLNMYNSPTFIRAFNIAATACQSLAGPPTTRGMLASVNLVAGSAYQTAVLQKGNLFTFNQTDPTKANPGFVSTFSQVGVMSLGLDFSAVPSTVAQGQNLLISGGITLAYDGQQVVEDGFLQYPEGVTAAVSTTGGFLGIGSYGYQVFYEWTDAQGQVRQSAASPVVSVTTTTATSSVTLTIPTLRLTMKPDVNVVVYRTAVNGTVYFRLNLPNAPKANLTSADTVTYVDTVADSTIAANQQSYLTGGEVENIPLPASRALTNFKNRVIGITSEAPGTAWWFSKEVIPGTPVLFADVFVKNVATDGGPLTAAAQLDANLILFKASSILFVQGSGPAPSGFSDDFTDAQALPSDVGCSNPASIVSTPQGLMFQSAKGIYLLDRSLNVQYVGAAVESLLQGTTVTGAELMTTVNQVRFTLSSGVAVVFDYLVGQWSTFTNVSATSAIVSKGVFTYVQANGLVNQETEGVYNDNGLPIRIRAVTAWLSLAGLQGFQRIYKLLVLGTYQGSHKLLVKVAYDFSPSFIQQTSIDATAVLSPQTFGADATFGSGTLFGGDNPLYQWRVNPSQQVCQAIQFSFESVQNVAPYTEGLTLSAFALEYGQKPGVTRKGASRSYGG